MKFKPVTLRPGTGYVLTGVATRFGVQVPQTSVAFGIVSGAPDSIIYSSQPDPRYLERLCPRAE